MGPDIQAQPQAARSVDCAVKNFLGTDFCLLIKNKSFGKEIELKSACRSLHWEPQHPDLWGVQMQV